MGDLINRAITVYTETPVIGAYPADVSGQRGRAQSVADGVRLFAILMRFVAALAALWVTVDGFATGQPLFGFIGLLLFAVALGWALLRLRMLRDSRRRSS